MLDPRTKFKKKISNVTGHVTYQNLKWLPDPAKNSQKFCHSNINFFLKNIPILTNEGVLESQNAGLYLYKNLE